MCESRDIQAIADLWMNEGWGRADMNYDNDGYILEVYLYLGRKVNTYTHIHISWSRRYEQYDYVLTCLRDHTEPEYMSCNMSYIAYVQEFAQLLQGCPGAGGGSRKNRKSRKSRKTRRNQ